MRCRPCLRVASVAFLVAFVLGVSGHVARAARDAISVEDTEWQSAGFMKLKGIPEAPTTPLLAAGTMTIGLHGTPEAPGPFTLFLEFLEEDLLVQGTYAEPRTGKPVFFINPALLQAQFDSPPFFLQAASLKARTRSASGIPFLDVKLSVKLKVCAVGGNPAVKCKNGRVSYKGTGIAAVR